MKKLSVSLLVVAVSLLFILVVVILSGRGVERVYFAHPPQLNTSVDFRSDGRMFMVSQDEGAWFAWRREGGKIVAEALTEKYKGRVITFDIRDGDLFIRDIRFVRQ
jgi:predicted membrane GTPase involved in stress response